MILRFSSGSETPASADRKRSAASTTTRSTPVAATKSFSTCSASPERSSPWSTNTQVSWSPTAFCTRAAATEESTPPERAQRTRDSPTFSRIEVDQLLDDVGRGPVAREPGATVEEVLEHPLAEGRVHHLGVPLDAVEPALVVLERRDRRAGGGGGDRHPGGCLGDRVAVAHPDRLVGGLAVEQGRRGVGDRRRRRAELRQPGVLDRAAEGLRPSPGSRSTCRTPAPRPRAARGRARARPPRRPRTGHRTA